MQITPLLRLLAFALSHPLTTLRLINVQMLRNAMEVLFRSSAGQAQQSVDQFLNVVALANGQHLDMPDDPYSSELSANCLTFSKENNVLVSIIIPVYNAYPLTLHCLRYIQKNTTDIAYEIIIADDYSSDLTRQITQQVKNITVVRTPKNLGFLRNCNHAASYAKGKYLLLLNNDAFVQAHCLQELVRLAEQDHNIGIVGPKLLYPNGKLQEAGGIIWDDGSGWNYGKGDDPKKADYNYVKEVDYISAACLLVRTTHWQAVHGFDTRFAPAYYEDTDLAFSIRKKGYKVVYQPTAVVVHLEGASHGLDETVGIKAYQTTNRDIFRKKWAVELKNNHFPYAQDFFLACKQPRNQKIILVIDHYVPRQDKDAGSRSTFQYLKLLAESNLRVIFLADNFHQDEPYTRTLQQLGIAVLYGKWYVENCKKWLQSCANQFDYIYLMRPHITVKYLRLVKKLTHPKILYQGHDLHHLRIQRQYALQADRKTAKEAKRWKKLEFKIFKQVEVIYYFSAIEVNEVKQHFPNACVRQLPIYIIDEITPLPYQHSERSGLLFVGGFNHAPNLDAVCWFVTEILPRIQRALPTITFTIVGSTMPHVIKALASATISVFEGISDQALAKHYRRCRAVVVPLRYGAGVNGKIIEALQFQAPVISTAVGAEGLPSPHHYLRIASDAAAFAEQVIAVYSEQKIGHELVAQGRQVISAHFSKKRAVAVLAQDIQLQN